MVKRYLAILMTLALVLGLFGMAGAETTELSPMTLQVFSEAANFQGEQVGWTAKLLKDKFNITLEIIAPQVAGDAIYGNMAAAGFLGDLVVLDNTDIQDAVSYGLIYDITEEMKAFESFEAYKIPLDFYNASLEGVEEGQYYAWPTELVNTSVSTYSPTIPGVAPTIPWDYYAEIGAPDLANLTDLIGALKAIQDLHPTNAAGDPSYGITLWKDWDGTSIENVNQLTKWYGQEIVNGNASILIDTEGNMIPLTDDASAYLKILKFFFDANQAGVVDPDSGTQVWDNVNQKFNSKRAFLIWNDWQQGFWNTTERGNGRENYMMVPLADMNLYQPSDYYFGSGRAFACGTDDPERKERVAMLMDWMSSPEGAQTIHAGIFGFTYEDAADGNGYVRTAIGETALMDNSPVPEEFGGGLYADGMLQINQWMLGGTAINPLTGYSYVGSNAGTWPAEVEKAKTTTLNEWAERFGAASPMAYLVENDLIGVVPAVNVNLPSDPTDMSLIRTTCGTLVCDASWKMIFAKDQAEFDALWAQLKSDLEGFGWNDLVKWDMEKHQVLVDERAKALAE
ncbi:MAG: sugar ABC transporter substrate-binding protein [Oscillospiraceae bacterium]|jgi:multiple sugar transport system substrate-binding protein/putative aldouronate transport system substrate-binding protein|nr:sugar ABC transporter substrate-binding protein [Oscillospiraceae bacterium]